ncbi:MAG: bifunctional chorismate mutase/prephenate dehydrogenase [Vicinamibacterales bacterium]|nr:bifunctional chorismate mutase/prephenate dehydrogenase [Vicinamibacterales bacterium]
MSKPLNDLRARLAEIDRQILALVGERQSLSTEIGAAKREAGLPLRDYRQEKVVIDRSRAAATDLGFDPGLAEQLLVSLIRASLAVQERGEVTARADGAGRRALVIGGAGKMGRWFVRFLASQGYQVEIADPSGGVEGHVHHADWRPLELTHDLIVVAAPLRASNTILLELAERAIAGVVFDIGSLKSPVRSGLTALAQAGARVTSIHPMFGPDTDLLSGRHVIFIDVGVAGATAEAETLFGSTMAVRVSMDLESHDRLIAWVLGLSHATNLVFLTALGDSGEAAPTLADLSSTTFDEQLRVADRVVHDSPQLYYEIQSLNEFGGESLTALRAAAERVQAIIEAGDEEGFESLMRAGRRYLEERRP